MIIGIVGPIASGKGEAVRLLSEAGFRPYSLSEEVRKEAQGRSLMIKREVLVEIGNEMRLSEPEYFARKTAEQILADGSTYAVIDGVRNPAEAEYLKREMDMVLIAIEAPKDVRLQRYLARNRNDDGKTAEDFYNQDRQDLGEGEGSHGQQVAACIAMADLSISNETDLETFRSKILELMSRF